MLEITFHIFCMALTALAMVAVFRTYGVHRRDSSEVTGSLYPPLILFVVYGVIPFQVYFLPQGELTANEGYYALSFLIMSIGGASYVVGFNSHKIARLGRRHLVRRNRAGRFESRAIFMSIAALDVSARASAIFQGTYFSWMAASIRQGGEVGASSLQMVMQGTGPLLGALALYLSGNSLTRRAYWVYKSYFFAIFFLILMQGNRGALTYFLIAAVLTWMHQRPTKAIPVFRIAMACVALVIGYKLVLDMRVLFVLNSADAVAEPVSFLSDAIKRSVLSLAGVTASIPVLELQGARFFERTLAWGHALSFQIAQLHSGTSLVGFAEGFRELASVIPKVLWVVGEKPNLVTGELLATHFGTAEYTKGDPATTSFSSAYLFGGVVGLIIFGFAFGILQRCLLELCKWWFGEVGKVLYIGSIAFIAVRANSFAAAFAGGRNFLVILGMAVAVLCIAKIVVRVSRGVRISTA